MGRNCLVIVIGCVYTGVEVCVCFCAGCSVRCRLEMWDQGGQPWQQWPLNQQQWMQSFQHQQDPGTCRSLVKGFCVAENEGLSQGTVSQLFCVAGQVDWAALAQAWIAQKESSGTTVEQQPPPPPPPPPQQQQQQQPNGQDSAGLDAHNNHTAFQNDSSFNRMWQPGRQTLQNALSRDTRSPTRAASHHLTPHLHKVKLTSVPRFSPAHYTFASVRASVQTRKTRLVRFCLYHVSDYSAASANMQGGNGGTSRLARLRDVY